MDDIFRYYQSDYPEHQGKWKISNSNREVEWEATRKAIKEAQDEWVRLNVVFVPISDYINSLKKAGKIK